jgi:hypothetical protein
MEMSLAVDARGKGNEEGEEGEREKAGFMVNMVEQEGESWFVS